MKLSSKTKIPSIYIKNIMQKNNNCQHYTLTLSDNRVIGLTSTSPSTHSWLNTFSEILSLNPYSSSADFSHNIVFIDSITKAKKNNNNSLGSIYLTNLQPKYSCLNKTIIEIDTENTKQQEIIKMWIAIMYLFRYALLSTSVPIHAACLEYKEKGIILAGSGGVGKSTCCKRLPLSEWKALSDDTTLITKATDESIRVHPMPTWSDHLWGKRFSKVKAEHSVPLHAIFFLKQGNEDKATPINTSLSLQYLFENCREIWDIYWNSIDYSEKESISMNIFYICKEIAKSIPCYILTTTLTGNFWEIIENTFQN